MSPEQLDALIRAGDHEAVERGLLDLPPAGRLALRKAAKATRDALIADADRHTERQLPQAVYQASWVAVFLTGTWTELKKRWWDGLPAPSELARLTQQATPAWLPNLAEALLPDRWDHVHALVRAGLLPEPDSRGYTLGMLHRWAEPLALLREDRDLREGALWRIFVVEGQGELSLSAHGQERWLHALIALSGEGLISRDRLLDATLQALTRGFAKGRVAPYEDLHDRLQPTPVEQIARVDLYLDVLTVGHPTSQRLALRALDNIIDAVEPGTLLTAISSLVTCPTKALATEALRRVERLRTATSEPPVEGEAVVNTLALGLTHPAPDVQLVALRALERLAPELPEEVAAAVAGSLDLLAPSLRERALHLCPDSAAPEPPPAEAPPTRIDPLDPARRLRPLPDLASLVHTLAHALEHPDDVEAIEQVLEAMATLPVNRDAAFATLTDGLRLRARQLPTRPKQVAPETRATPRALLAWLTTSWVQGLTAPPPATWPSRTRAAWGPATLWIARLEALVRRFDTPGLPLLATPTHRDGFVDPTVLALRLATLRAADQPIDPADLLTALQRLPHGASTTLDPTHEPEAVLAWALGQPAPIGGEQPAWWVAAARHRGGPADLDAVQRAFPELAGLDLSDRSGEPTFTRVTGHTWRDNRGKEHTVVYTSVAWTLPEINATVPSDRPWLTYQLHGCHRATHSQAVVPSGIDDWTGSVDPDASTDFYDRTDCAAVQPWNAALVPGQPEGFLSEALLLLWTGATDSDLHYNTHQGLLPLLSPGHRWSRWSWWVLAIGLGSRAPETQATAVDALLASLAHGAFDPVPAAIPVRALLFQGVLPAGRFASALGHVVAAGPAASRTVRDLLLHALTGTPAWPPKDLAKLLSLLQECCAAAPPTEVPAGFREFVQTLGSGAAAKAGKEVLRGVG
jgi:hypothetical protein